MDDPRWSEVTPDHLQASADALTDLADAVSTKVGFDSADRIYVDLVHYEHGYFLSPMLQGFPLLALADREERLPSVPLPAGASRDFLYDSLAEWADPEEVDALFTESAVGLVTPKGASADAPFTWAVVAARPVSEQLNGVIGTLASLLMRQTVVATAVAEGGNDLPRHLTILEEELTDITTGSVEAATRLGWRAAADELRVRAETAGTPLLVRYRRSVLSPSDLSRRAPLMREVYNKLAVVRAAVDRVTSGMSRAFYLAGEGPADVLTILNDQFETLSIRQFIAHAVRDSFVCGNGVLVLGNVTSGGFRLVQPEHLIDITDEVATINETGELERVGPVLHIPGGRQLDSPLGISFLEPFIVICAQRDTFLATLLTCAIARNQNDRRTIDWAIRMEPYAVEQLRVLEQRLRDTLGTVTDQFVDALPGTYFEGHEQMHPSAGRMTLTDRRADTPDTLR